MLIILWDVKEPAHFSLRVGHVVPGVVVCHLLCIMVGRVKKKGHSNWRKLLWRSASLTGKVNKIKNKNKKMTCLLVESGPLSNQCSGCNCTFVLTQQVAIKLRDLVFALSRNLLQLHVHGSDLLNFTEIRKPTQVIVSLAAREDN